MGLFDNLVTIVSAPVQIVDKVFVEPIAELAKDATEGIGIKPEK